MSNERLSTSTMHNETKSNGNGNGHTVFSLNALRKLYDVRRQRLRDIDDGTYYLLPDSAPSIPLSMLANINDDIISSAMADSPMEGPKSWRLGETDRERLIEFGGDSARAAIDLLTETKS